MQLAMQPCWGRRDAAICTDCTLLQMPADYTGSFPAMELQLPAVEYIGTDAEFCPNRRSAGTIVPGPSVGTELGAVSAVAHSVDCAQLAGAASPCVVGGGVASISTPGAAA